MSNFTQKPDKSNHKVLDDKLIRALNQTRPVGKAQHRNELEERLLAMLDTQSQSTDERHPTMQVQARSPYNIIPLRKMRISPILVATVVMIIIGTGLIFASGAGNPQHGADGGMILSQTPTVAPYTPDTCSYFAMGTAQNTMPVYAQDSVESDLLGEYQAGDEFVIIGQNYLGDWLVVQWSDEYIGWVENLSALDNELDVVLCEDLQANTILDNTQPTALPPTIVPTSTPFGISAEVEDCEIHRISRVRLLSETTVYAWADTASDAILTLEAGTEIQVIGVNREQDWFVVTLPASYVGWFEIADMEYLHCLILAPPTELYIIDTFTPLPTNTPMPPPVQATNTLLPTNMPPQATSTSANMPPNS